MNSIIKNIFTAAILTALFMAMPATALAHKVSIFAWVEGDMVHTVSKFSGGVKVKKGLVTVYDSNGKKLLDGRTDDQGEFSFRIPQKTALRVELAAGPGHKGYWDVPLEEIAGTAEPAAAAAAQNAPAGKTVKGDQTAPCDSARLQAAIEKALDKKLKPVTRLLAEAMQPGPSFTEILGGIGYIIGLVGLAAYFKSRQKHR